MLSQRQRRWFNIKSTLVQRSTCGDTTGEKSQDLTINLYAQKIRTEHIGKLCPVSQQSHFS